MQDQKVINDWKNKIQRLPQPEEGRAQAWTEKIGNNRVTFRIEKHSPNAGVIKAAINGEWVSTAFWDYNSNGGGLTYKSEKIAWEKTKTQLAGLFYKIK